MRGRRAEVDGGDAFAFRVPSGYVLHADLKFQRRRDAVIDLCAIVRRAVAVAVQVDKAGSNDQTGYVEFRCTAKLILADGGDRQPLNADIADRVQSRSRIDHPAPGQDHVVDWPLGATQRCQNQNQQHMDRSHALDHTGTAGGRRVLSTPRVLPWAEPSSAEAPPPTGSDRPAWKDSRPCRPRSIVRCRLSSRWR